MDDKTYRYRTAHKRCRYCKYLEHHSRDLMFEGCYWYECTLKDKIINLWCSWKGWICSWYSPKED